MSGQQEVEKFLQEIGLESCVQAVVHNGFYTSMEALRGATYEELVDSGVRNVHAKLILSNLGSKGGYGAALAHDSAGGAADEVNHFLRSVGLENCASQLAEAGFTSLDKLGEATMSDLQAAGLKPVHARLIASNLDSASTAAVQMTPAAQRLATLESEADDALLGLPRKKRPKRARLAICIVFILFVAAAAWHALYGGTAAAALGGEGAAGGHEHKGKGSGGGTHGGGGAHSGGGGGMKSKGSKTGPM